jgi:cytochrome c
LLLFGQRPGLTLFPNITASPTSVGSVANYQYCDANKNSGIVWNEATFKEYIKDPKAKIPGTKMAFAGIKNDQEINDLWAYLKQFDANGNIKK